MKKRFSHAAICAAVLAMAAALPACLDAKPDVEIKFDPEAISAASSTSEPARFKVAVGAKDGRKAARGTEVQVTTTLGHFKNTADSTAKSVKLLLDDAGSAAVELLSDAPGTALVVATFDKVSKETSVTFAPAAMPPFDFSVASDRTQPELGKVCQITATVTGKNGAFDYGSFGSLEIGVDRGYFLTETGGAETQHLKLAWPATGSLTVRLTNGGTGTVHLTARYGVQTKSLEVEFIASPPVDGAMP
jgi:hypothetical protein